MSVLSGQISSIGNQSGYEYFDSQQAARTSLSDPQGDMLNGDVVELSSEAQKLLLYEQVTDYSKSDLVSQLGSFGQLLKSYANTANVIAFDQPENAQSAQQNTDPGQNGMVAIAPPAIEIAAPAQDENAVSGAAVGASSAAAGNVYTAGESEPLQVQNIEQNDQMDTSEVQGTGALQSNAVEDDEAGVIGVGLEDEMPETEDVEDEAETGAAYGVEPDLSNEEQAGNPQNTAALDAYRLSNTGYTGNQGALTQALFA